MSKVRFTSGRIANFECAVNQRQDFLWDSEVSGFGLRVTDQGKKTYIFQGRVGKTSLRMTIGNIKDWSIDDAKKEARRLQTLCDTGVDPRVMNKNNILESAAIKAKEDGQQLLFKAAWDKYIEAHKKVWGVHHLSDHFKVAHEGGRPYKYNSEKKTIAGPVGALLDTRLIDITSEYLEKWIKRENETRPTQAALAFRLVRGFLNWCEDQKEFTIFTNLDAHKSRKVRRAVRPPQSKKGSLQKEQLESWFREVRALNNQIASAYLQTVVLTGSRREADASLKWVDIDFEWKSINLWDKVESRKILIPLTPYVEELLKGLPRVNEYVFASKRSETGYIAEPRTAQAMALKAANLPHVTIHDLRRTFSNMCEWVDIPAGIKNQLMGHKPKTTDEKHYTQRSLDFLRLWHIRIEKWIITEAKVNFYCDAYDGVVLPLIDGVPFVP